MSKQVDERVVEMRFDNAQFESNVKTSMNTLQKFKQSLNLTDSAKGLTEVGTAAKKIDLTGIGSAAESVQAKFSAFGAVGFSVLSRITNAAIDCAKSVTNMISSFGGLESAKAGLQEYETQLNAVQTILANTQSKGSTLDDVNSALDELNKYADLTIYNFTEMTRNIGTFTAAGVDLDKSVSSIKGIANLAAVSGSTSAQASTAMYQLSQALAAGRVSLMDWNSVVNAGMGGQLFQEALKRTARNMGMAVDEAIEKYGSFRESLTQGEWLTTDVLTETLTQLSGAYTEADLIAQGYTEDQAREITELAETAVNAATKVKTFTQLIDTLKEAAQSGWTETWELIVGDFEEAKALWTEFSDFFGEIIGNKADKRNTLLAGALQSNWSKLVTQLEEAGIENDKFTEAVTAALEKHGYNVTDLTTKYGSLEKAFQSGTISTDILREAIDNLNTSTIDLSGVATGLDYGAGFDGYSEDVAKVQQALIDLGYDLGEFGDKADGVDGQLGTMTQAAITAFQEANGLEITGIVDQATLDKLEELSTKTQEVEGDFSSLIDEIDKLGGRDLLVESVWNVINAIADIAGQIGKAWEEIFPPATSEQLYGIIEGIHDFTENLKLNQGTLNRVKFIFKGFFAVLDIGKKVIGAIFDGIKPLFGSVGGLGDGFLLAASKIGAWLVALDESIDQSEILEKAVKPVIEFLKDLIDALADFVKGFVDSFELPDITPFIEGIKGLIESFKEMLNTPFAQKLKTFFGNIKDAFGSFGSSFGTLFSDILQKIADFLNSIFDPDFDLGEALKTLGSGIVDAFKGFGGSVKQAVVDAWNNAFGEDFTFDDAVALVGEKIGDFIESVKQFATDAYENIKTFFEEHSLSEIITDIFSGVGSIDAPEINVASMFGFSEDSTGANIVNGIVDFFTGTFESVKNGVTAIYDGIKSFIEDHTPAKAVEEGLMVAVGAANDEKNSVDKAVLTPIGIPSSSTSATGEPSFVDTIISFFSGAFEKIKSFFSGVGDVFGALFDGISSIFSGVGEALKDDTTFQFWSDFFGGVATLISGIVHAIGVIFEGVGNTLLNADFDQLIDIFTTVFRAIVVFNGLRFVYNISSLFKGASDLFDGISDFIEDLGKKKEVKLKESFATKLLKIGAGFLAIAAGMKIFASAVEDFGTMDTDTLETGLLCISLLLLGMSGIIKATESSKGVASAGVGILAIAVAMKIFAWAAKDLGAIDPEVLVKAGIAIGVLVYLATQFVKSTKNSKKMVSAGIGIIALAAAMKIFASAAKNFAEMEWEDLGKAGAAIGTLVLLASAFTMATKFSSNMISAGLGIIALAAAMKILASVAKDFGEMEWEDLGKAGAAFAVIMAGILAFTYLTGKSGKMLSSAAAIVVVGIAVKLIASAAKDMAEVEWEDLGKLGTLIAELAVVVAGLAVIGKLKLSGSIFKGLLTVAGVVLAIGGVLTALGWLDQQFNLKSFVSSGGDLLCKVGETLQRVVDSFANLEFAGFMLVATALGVTDGIIGGAMAKGALQMAGVVGLVGALIAAFGWLQENFDIQSFVNSGGDLLCAVGNSLQRVVDSFATLEFAGFLLVATALGATGGVFMGMMLGGALQMTAVVGVVGALIAAFGWLQEKFDIKMFVSSGGDLLCTVGSVLQRVVNAFATLEFLGFIGVATLLGATGGVFAGLALGGTLQMTAVIGVVGALIAGFGWLQENYDLETFVNSGGNLLCAVANNLQKVVNAFATLEFAGFLGLAETLGLTGGFALIGGVTGTLQLAGIVTAIGTLLGAFGWLQEEYDLESFINSGGDLLCSVATQIGNVISALTTGITTAITDAGIAATDDMPQIGTNLSDFATNAQTFIDTIQGIDDGLSEKSGIITSVIGDIIGLALRDGFTSAIFGDNNIVKMGEKIDDFADEIASAFATFEGVDPETAENAKAAIAKIEEIMEPFGVDGNPFALLGNILDNASFTNFTDSVSALGTSLGGFYDAVGGKVVELDAAVTMLQNLINVFNSYTGKDVTDLATQIDTISTKMSAFATALGETNNDKLQTAIANVQDLKDLITSLDGFDASEVTEFITAIDNLTTASVSEFAKAFESDSANQSITDAVNAMVGAMIVELHESMTAQLLNISKIVPTYLADGISENASIATDSIAELVSTMLDTAALQYDMFEIVGKSCAVYLSYGIEEASDIVIDSMNVAASAVVDTAALQYDSFDIVGKMYMTNLAAGINFASTFASSAVAVAVSAAVSVASGVYDRFYALGKNLVLGFANGISANTWQASAQAAAMANSAYNAAQVALDSHSPSRKFFELGSYVSMGMANGMKQYANLVAVAGEDLGNTAISGTQSVLSNLGSMLDGSIDAQPVIRPVLDLSDVEYGARSLDTMFGYANAGRIDFMMNDTFQNGGTNRVLSAIDELGKNLGNMGGTSNIYNVNGITYDDGSNVSSAVESLVRAARIERRV